jgi:hypothetical protein
MGHEPAVPVFVDAANHAARSIEVSSPIVGNYLSDAIGVGGRAEVHQQTGAAVFVENFGEKRNVLDIASEEQGVYRHCGLHLFPFEDEYPVEGGDEGSAEE